MVLTWLQTVCQGLAQVLCWPTRSRAIAQMPAVQLSTTCSLSAYLFAQWWLLFEPLVIIFRNRKDRDAIPQQQQSVESSKLDTVPISPTAHSLLPYKGVALYSTEIRARERRQATAVTSPWQTVW